MHEMIIIVGVLNEVIKFSKSDNGKLESFNGNFRSTNLIHSETCFMRKSQQLT